MITDIELDLKQKRFRKTHFLEPCSIDNQNRLRSYFKAFSDLCENYRKAMKAHEYSFKKVDAYKNPCPRTLSKVAYLFKFCKSKSWSSYTLSAHTKHYEFRRYLVILQGVYLSYLRHRKYYARCKSDCAKYSLVEKSSPDFTYVNEYAEKHWPVFLPKWSLKFLIF